MPTELAPRPTYMQSLNAIAVILCRREGTAARDKIRAKAEELNLKVKSPTRVFGGIRIFQFNPEIFLCRRNPAGGVDVFEI